MCDNMRTDKLKFSEFLAKEIGPNWVVARRTARIVRKYGKDVVTISHKQYAELEEKWRQSTMSDKPTTSKHTPGPWQITRECWPADEHAYNILIESATDVETRGTGGRKIASIPRSLGIAESAANARLIASAPELLATLREFCQDVQTGGPNIAEDWPDLYVTYQHAQAAIAKAEGKDHA